MDVISKLRKGLILTTVSCSLMACVSNNSSADSRNLTLGLVQKEITTGISSIKVIEALGSPNIVKKSPETQGEVWVYDKISYSSNESNLGINIGAAGSDVAGLLGAGNKNSQSSSKSLTVIIKFDKNDTVKDVSYFRSSF